MIKVFGGISLLILLWSLKELCHVFFDICTRWLVSWFLVKPPLVKHLTRTVPACIVLWFATFFLISPA